jgi:hypothetical protein
MQQDQPAKPVDSASSAWIRTKSGSGAKFIKCMFLSGEWFSRLQAAKTLAHISGAVVAFPVSGLRFNDIKKLNALTPNRVQGLSPTELALLPPTTQK